MVALYSGQRFEAVGATTSSASDGTQVDSHASNNTKGSYFQLIASTAFAYTSLEIEIGFVTGGNDWLIDIAIGAAASEQIIIANFHANPVVALQSPATFNVLIPAGVRISARAQSSTGGSSIWVKAVGRGGGTLARKGMGRVTTYGANTSDSGGVVVDAGGTANTKSSYSEITSATTAPIRELILAFGNAGDTSRVACRWLMDLAIGAAASEQIIIPNILLNHPTGTNIIAAQTRRFEINIPAGVRLAARAQCTTNTAGDRTFDILAYGVD